MSESHGKKIDNRTKKIAVALFFTILLLSSSSAFTYGAFAQLGSLTNSVTSTTSALTSTLAQPITSSPIISSPVIPNNTVISSNSVIPVLPSPSGFSATAVSSSQISLNWNAPSNSGNLVTGYMIERSSDSGTTWSTVKSNTGTTSTIYLDSGLAPSTSYTYRVSAVYDGGITSPPSNTASATTKSATSTLTVSTQLSTGETLTGFYVELRNSTGQVAATGFSPATFVLKNGAQYTVGMGNFATDVFDHWADTGSTTNPLQVSISSDTQLNAIYKDTALTLVPSSGPVGTNVSVTGANSAFSSSTAVTLSWDGISNATTITSNSTGGFMTTFQVPNASNGSHKIQATDGTNTHSAPFMVGPTGPIVPQPPTGLTANTISSSQINLSWAAPSDNGGSAITGYQIERSQDNGTTWSIISSNASSTAYSDTGLSPSTTYIYRVSAINSVGTSTPSNTASATTQSAQVTVPQPPTGLTANTISSSQINLSWTAPSDQGSSPITGYKIERSQDNGTTWLPIVSNTGSTSTTYSDTGLAPSTFYTYRVSAINSVGTSAPSNTASAKTQSATTLLSPSGLTATAVSSSQISLNWNAPSNSGNLVTGYMIERSSDSGTTWSTVKSNTGTTSTIYLDSGLAPSTSYTYRVSAVYDGGITSPPSNTASATTQSSTYKLTVSTQLSTGDPLTGMYTELRNSSGIVSTGFSPATFVLKNGAQYTVGMGNFATDVFDHWADTGSTTNPRPVSISGDTQLIAVYKDTALTLAPSRGPADTNVTVTGTTFSPTATITLSWDGTILATVTSNSAGEFTTTFQVPSTATPGTHKVQATDGTNTHSAPFTVGPPPSISFNTDTVNVGAGVRVTGTNFAPSSLITISFDGTPYVQNFTNDSTTPSVITTDSNGGFVAIIETLRAVTGTYIISVQDSENNIATKSITVTPHVFIYPTSGHAGSVVLIPASQGNGFAANSAITIKFDGITITSSATMLSDASGSFGGSFTVPSTAVPGSHQIQVSDGNGNTYSTSFTVMTSTSPTYSVQSVITGLNFPDRFAFIPDNGPGVNGSGALMTLDKNSGTVSVFKYTNGQFVNQSKPFVIVPNLQTGFEANGLLGIAFDPNWVTSKLVYFDVTRTVSGNVVSEIIRYHATTDSSGNIIADTSVGEQLVLDNIPAWKDGHNGGDLKFDSQGNLYVAIGDGWNFAAPQDLTTLQGKILRITPLASPVDGKLYSIPSTNPFASSTNTSIKKEIWGYGVRHPWSLDIDSHTGKLYVSDVGYNSWERIENFTTPGVNAGWPNYEGPAFGNPQNLASYTSQLYWYPHEGVEPQTGPTAGLEAISSGAFYHGTYYPNLNGAYFFGDYGVGNIVALLPSSIAPSTTDPASGDPKGQVVPIYYGLNGAPVDITFWNGKLYFVDINGNLDVLNYN